MGFGFEGSIEGAFRVNRFGRRGGVISERPG